MGRFDIFPIFIATFASRRVTLIATHSKSQKQTRLPIRYLYFILPFKPLINKEVIKVFQNYGKFRNKQIKEEWDYFSSIYYLTLIFNTVSPSRTFACRCLTPENKNATDWIVQSVAFSEYCFLILFQRLQADYSAVRC